MKLIQLANRKEMENNPPAMISDSPKRSFNRGNTDPMSTMETPNKEFLQNRNKSYCPAFHKLMI